MVLRHLMRILAPDRKEARNLTREESFRAFRAILEGGESDILTGAFLTTMRLKGVTVQELTGFAEAARATANIPCTDVPGLVCLCSPLDGQDQHPPLDVAAGLVAASAGARVLILSDRGVPPRRGLTAANAMDAIQLSMTWDPSEAEDWVAKGRFAVLAISGMLPAMLNVRQIRGELTIRTPLSTVEKLLAPRTSAVVLGAQSGPVLGTAVEVMQGLGHPRGIAIQGIEGGVIPSVRKRTRGIEMTDGHCAPVTVEPQDFGLDLAVEPELPMFGPPEEGRGTSDNPALVEYCGERILSVLRGDLGPDRNATLLGAALILKSSGRCPTLAEGVDAAVGAIDGGKTSEQLEYLQTLSH